MHNMEQPDMNHIHQAASGASPSAQSQQDALKALKKEFLKTAFFLIAVIAVLVYGSAAWFVANTQVRSYSASVSAQYDRVRIASKGHRQSAEEQILNLPEGTIHQYGGDDYYYTESGEIALRLAEDYFVSPGARGSVDLYIIPDRDGAMTVTLYFGLTGYAEQTSEAGTKVEPVEDPVLNALLSGHILLFQTYQNGHYSQWLGNQDMTGFLNNAITITLPEDAKKDTPYPVTLYWIWPLRYENMVEDLYTPNSQEFTAQFLPFVEAQASNMTSVSETTPYKYSRIFLTKGELESRSEAYNLADEYIGTNANYLYLTIRTGLSENGPS